MNIHLSFFHFQAKATTIKEALAKWVSIRTVSSSMGFDCIQLIFFFKHGKKYVYLKHLL